MWLGIVLACLGCYALKYAGMSIPQRALDSALVRRIAALLPVGLLAALAATQALSSGAHLVVDGRIVGVLASLLAIRFRAPFIAVVAVSAVVTVNARPPGAA